MKSQHKFVITAALLCHLFLGAPLVISQAQPAGVPAKEQGAAKSQLGKKLPISATEGEPVTIKAREQEKAGDLYTLRGEVEIQFRNNTLRADTITYNSSTGEITATGNLVFDGGLHDEHITASHGSYNVRTQTGKFYDVAGTTGARFKGRNVVLTSSSPIAFSGKLVEKTGPEEYVIHDGTITSCELPHPKWIFSASTIKIEVGDSAKIYNTVFKVKGIPVVYLPFASPPVERLGRQSGFLIPTLGTSSRKGTILGDSFYWAIDRSMDTTLGAEYFSQRGWALRDTFRARPSDKAYLNLDVFSVIDRGFGRLKQDQGGEDIKLNGEAIFPHDIRGVASLNYLSSFVFRLAFTENFSQAVNSEVKSVAFLSKTLGGFSLNTFASRYQNFESTNPGDLVTIFHAPGIEVSTVDQRLGRLPLYWTFDAASEGLRRTEPGFDTPNLVGRFDISPRVSMPLFYRGWTIRPEIGLRNTFYTEERIPTAGVGVAVQEAVNRRSVETNVEFRPPTMGKIFDHTVAGRKVKHTIEPRLIYSYTNGIDNFPAIIRFDFRDIVSDTNEVEYGLTQRLYLKRSNEDCGEETLKPTNMGQAQEPGLDNCTPAGAHEFISWEVKQKYFIDPNFGGAVVNGRRNVLTTTEDFAGIAFLTDPRRFSPVVSKLRMRTSANTSVQWELDYDSKKGQINASSFYTTFRLSNFFVEGSHAFFHVPGEIFVTNPTPTCPLSGPRPVNCSPTQFNQFRALVGYGSPTKRGLSAAANLGFDSTFRFIQYGAAQASYNWDCCGLSFEYRRFALGAVRNENQYRFAFTLANIGSFGNLKRQERLF
ncbi:MAG TPA: LPS assembly protein LptD [Candidatus Angelobacter sp.]|nr:LPS assembly protein LptD [Candidatus Angelobacter sp.]